MQNLKKLADILLARLRGIRIDLREKVVASVTASLSILFLLFFVQHVDLGLPFKMLVLASMGASAFLLFVAPHSPMAQPWPVIGGHLIAALIGVACARWITDSALAAATAVLLSIFVMHVLHCLHPPSAATAMIAVPGRRYPMLHTHHAHHQKFVPQEHLQHPELLEADFKWALGQMDGLIDVSAEDLLDIYEFAVERAQARAEAGRTELQTRR